MLDKELIFNENQEVTSTADSTDSLDLGAGTDHAGNAIVLNAGESGRMWLNVAIPTAYVSGTSVAFKLQDSADDNSFADTQIDTGAIVVETLVAGYTVLRMPMPPDTRRYVKMVYTVVGSPSAGKITTWIGTSGQA